MTALLAVDLGVRTGFSCWGDDGRLRWYRSQNFGSAARLRRAIPALLDREHDFARVVVEGGGPLATLWVAAVTGRSMDVRRVSAEEWRSVFLLPREQRSAADAKLAASRLARLAIAWGGGRAPTSLRHDAAEAVLIGLWGAVEAGWIRRLPPELIR